MSSHKPVFIGLNYRCRLHLKLKELLYFEKLFALNKSPALLLSIVSRQHGSNNRTITGQGSAVATIFTKPRMLYVCEVILEYDGYDVLLKCVLPANIKRLLQVVE